MTRSRKILAVLGMLLALALAGCVRFQADMSVDEQNRLDGHIVVAVIAGDEAGDAENAEKGATGIEASLLPNLRGADGVTAERYEQDDYIGTRFTLDDTPIDALGGGSDGALTLTRVGDEFEFSGTLDFTPGSEPLPADEVDGDPGDADITVAISFPGEVLEHNGQLSGNHVTWTTTLEGSVDMEARASAIPSGPPAWLWAVAAGAAFLIAVVLAVVILRVRGRRLVGLESTRTPGQ
jgi:hypothetical protein